MKRLLALDGGGLRGIFTLKILEEMERQLQQAHNDPNYRLCDHFHYIGGTSTGAIIAAMLSWGRSASEVLELYKSFGAAMFQKRRFWQRYKSKFDYQGLTAMLKKLFSEDGEGKVLAELGTDRLKTFLLIVTRNASTGSDWPITNNPNALYNRKGTLGCNLKFPIWQLLRASTAAPTFFPPEVVTIYGEGSDYEKGVTCSFEDGGITPYNNPAYLLYLKATLPEYHMNWATGEDNLHLVSVGTGLAKLSRETIKELHILNQASILPPTLIQSYQINQDLMCRATGKCLFGEPIDSEVGDMIRPHPNPAFTYVRYNHTFTDDDFEPDSIYSCKNLPMDDLNFIPVLEQFGADYATKYVSLHHLR